MNRSLRAAVLALSALTFPRGAAPPLRAADASADGVEFFEKKVRPVLVAHCYRCHADKGKAPKGGLRLDSRAALLKGGDNGPALTPGRPDRSRLIEALGYGNADLQMPPKGKLPDAVIADLAAWVKMGAPWPKEGAGAAAAKDGFDLPRRRRAHWAWQPVRPPAPPAVRDAAWPRGPVDRFLLARLEAQGLRPAPPADRRTLLRRVTFDLTGLPPTPAEVEAFLRDDSPAAFERVVDRLLAGPALGERWARHWLDLVRYAETRGHEYDYPIPNASQYRDYVIRAFNEDVPYNQFVVEHVAGDLLDRPRLTPEGGNESVLGTGFWLLGEEVHSPVDLLQDQADRFDNRIDVMTKAFLGLTVACARCHDHKFDAISTQDYYALFGIVASSTSRQVRFDARESNRRVAADLARQRDRARTALGRALAEAARPATERLPEYLMAARAVLLAGPESTGGKDKETRKQGNKEKGPRSVSPCLRVSVSPSAAGLDPGRLAAWVTVLRDAARDRDDPLHAWAVAAADPAAGSPGRLAEVLKPLAEEMRRRDAAAADALAGAQVMVDYASNGQAEWLPDGPAFGPGPARPGEVRLGGDASRPAVRFVERAAAEYDRAWDVLRPAPGAQPDPGALGQLPGRVGRTLCTPTFPLTTGKLFYLVRGAGAAYASVAAHTMIAGPLHAQLVTSIRAGGDFRWVAHDLTPYKGYQVHVEFTPAPGSDFAVALVVQGDRAPGALGRPNGALLRLLAGDEAQSLSWLAAGYGRLFAAVVDRLAGGKVGGGAEAADTARLAQWLVNHPALLGDRARAFSETASALHAVEQKLAAHVRPESRLAPALLDGTGVGGRVYVRGSPKAPGEVVPRRFLEALAGAEGMKGAPGSGRLELARQMTDPILDPFLARVMVNRVWHHLFGRGLVASVDNFGVLGEAPTHPELLDHLADRFVKESWSVKRLVRALVLSSAYRMSSQPVPGAEALDPQNLLLHRARLRRLEGEAVRDAMLAASGRLDRRMYGPSVPIHLTPFLDGRGRPEDGPLDGAGRRSLYLAVRRNFLSPLLLAFDTPAPFSTVGRRTVSNVPAQALILMNDPFVHQQAEGWARKVLARPGTAADRVRAMYLAAFGRPAGEAELSACLAFLNQQARRYGAGPDDVRVWADLAHTLFNVKEFIFLG
jgi:cytochrome c553